MPRLLAFLAACCLFLPLTGCNDKDDPAGPDTGFDNPDQLVAAFVARYQDMDLAGYRDDLLAPGYRFILQPQTVIDYDLPRETLSRADEEAIVTAMFSGQPSSLGEVLASVEFVEFMPQGQWLAVEPTDPYFGDVAGALVRSYAITMYFNVQGDQRYEVSGSQHLYVTGDSCHLLGQLDLTGDGKGVEAASWSDIKALWW